VLNAPRGASGEGHMAILIQNKDGKYSLWSKNGTNENGGFHGANNKGDQAGVGSFDSPEGFLNSKLNPVIDKKTGEREYSEGFLIPTTEKQDRAAEAGFKEVLKEDYDLLNSSCATAVQVSLDKAGLYTGSPERSPLEKALSVLNVVTGNVKAVAQDIRNEKGPNKIYDRVKDQNWRGSVVAPK